MQMSAEQADIVNKVKEGKNVTVIACAGSGKTTTILFMGRECPKKSFLVLTFNRRLAEQSRARIQKESSNPIIETQTYHGFCMKYFGECHNDTQMRNYVNARASPRFCHQLLSKDVLVMDEVQDMSELYYRFIRNALTCMRENIQIVLIGDPRQTIFTFNGGCADYLLGADKYFGNAGRTFERCTLSVSYRLTPKVTKFLNTLIASKYDLTGMENFQITAGNHKTDKPVKIYWTNLYKSGHIIIQEYLNKYGPENVLIMAPSIKSGSKSPICHIMNVLKDKFGTYMYHLSDDQRIDDELIQGKLVVSTIHKQKGCEQKCVIVVGMDCSYYKYHGNRATTLAESLNVIYVSLSRSLEELVILGSREHTYLPIWREAEVRDLIRSGSLVVEGANNYVCSGSPKCDFRPSCACVKELKILPVTELLRYKPAVTIADLVESSVIDITSQKGKSREISFETKIIMKSGLMENTAQIYGYVVPIVVEFITNDRIGIVESYINGQADLQDVKMMQKVEERVRRLLRGYYDRLKKTVTFNDIYESGNGDDIYNLLAGTDNLFPKIAVCLMCYDNYEYPIQQIDTFTWFDVDDVAKCAHRLKNFVDRYAGGGYEIGIGREFHLSCVHNRYQNWAVFRGRADYMTPETIVEFKLKRELQYVDYAQVILYMYIHQKSSGCIYYPSVDTVVDFKVADMTEFKKFVDEWLSDLCTEHHDFYVCSTDMF